jgi:hypothetical protein
LYIHNFSINAVDSTDQPIKLSPGLSTELKISRIFSKKLGEPYNTCLDDLNKLKSSQSILIKHILTKTKSTYRQVDCFDLCHARYIIQTCNLDIQLDFTWELDPVGNYECARKEYEIFLKKGINEHCSFECPLECEWIEYRIEVMTTKFPSAEYAKALSNDPKIKEKYPIDYNITYDDLHSSLVSFR